MRKLFHDHKNDITKIFVSTLSAINCMCTLYSTTTVFKFSYRKDRCSYFLLYIFVGFCILANFIRRMGKTTLTIIMLAKLCYFIIFDIVFGEHVSSNVWKYIYQSKWGVMMIGETYVHTYCVQNIDKRRCMWHRTLDKVYIGYPRSAKS